MSRKKNNARIVRDPEAGVLRVRFQFDAGKVMAIRKVPGREWDEDLRCWVLPDTTDTMECLYTIFGTGLNVARGGTHLLFEDPLCVQEMRRLMRSRRLSDSTVEVYCRYMGDLLEFTGKPVEEIVEEDITAYLSHHREIKKSSSSTINLAYNGIKYYFKQVERKNIVPRGEWCRKPKRLPFALSAQEVALLLDSTRSLKEKVMLTLIYSAGTRLTETTRIRMADIDRDRMTIFIHRGKGAKDRYTILSPSVLEMLDRYLENYRPLTYLFEGSVPGRPISPRTVQLALKRALRRAGITKRASVHTLRHSFATHLVDGGTDIHHVQRLLGHKGVKTTMVYLHLSNDSLRKVVSPYDELEGK